MTISNVTENKPTTCTPACSSESGVAKNVRKLRPQYRVRELDTSYVVTVDLPGVPKEAVQVQLIDGVLELSASRSWASRADWSPLAGASEDGVEYWLRLEAGDEIDGSSIEAKLDAGVLKIILAKAENKKPRRISIK